MPWLRPDLADFFTQAPCSRARRSRGSNLLRCALKQINTASNIRDLRHLHGPRSDCTSLLMMSKFALSGVGPTTNLRVPLC